MVRSIHFITFLLPCILFGFSESDLNREIIALQDKPARGLVIGQIYTITLVQDDTYHAQTTGGGVGIHSSHEGLQWDFYDSNVTAPPITQTASLFATRHYLVQHVQDISDTDANNAVINYLLDVAVDYQVGLTYSGDQITTCNIEIIDIRINNSSYPTYSFIAGMQGYPTLSYKLNSVGISTGVSTNTSSGIQREVFTFSNTGFGSSLPINFPINFSVDYITYRDPSGLNQSFSPSFNFQSSVNEVFRVLN